jgi:hypothetical protein
MFKAIRGVGLVLLVTGGVLVDSHAQNIPVTAAPTGFGNYCSIVYPGGGWAFVTLIGTSTDPCGDQLKASPGGTIERAGLWAVNGQNNAMVRCDGTLILHRETGSKATGLALAGAKGKTNCVFTIAPTALPVFGRPYGKTTSSQSNPDSDVSIARGFDYNVYRLPMNVADFGQTPNPSHPEAHSVDRKGKQRCRLGSAGECGEGKPAGCHIVPGESAYDWPMPKGKPILSVADGIVRSARDRDVTSFGCGSDKQKEIYIEHQIGKGEYAERFVSYYAHMSKISVKTGDKVVRGQKIGEAGNTGCSGGNHLHFSVLRLTNLTGTRSYAFQTTPDGYGVNGIHGVIDPFGWAAPKNIDPLAWKFLGDQNDPILGTIKDPGAFSIKLWRTGQAPPSNW